VEGYRYLSSADLHGFSSVELAEWAARMEREHEAPEGGELMFGELDWDGPTVVAYLAEAGMPPLSADELERLKAGNDR
jgi:hypothetical protein